MSNAPTGDSAPGYGEAVQRRFPGTRWVARVDDAVYALERVVVTAAMLVMSGVVCLSVLYQFVAKQKATFDRLGETTTVGELWPALAVVLCIALLARGVWAQSPACRNNFPAVAALTAITVLKFSVFAVLLVVFPPPVMMVLIVIAVGVWVLLAELDRPQPLGAPLFSVATKMRAATVGGVTLAAVWGVWDVHPESYSWTNKLALFLLLWTAFIGASMATHDQRHLAIDAVRKAMPARILPHYQAVSHFIAAAFTAAFAYLAFLYFADRLPETTAPGDIPDWLKVLAIPVSLSLVTLRFLGQSIAAGLVGLLGLSEEGTA